MQLGQPDNGIPYIEKSIRLSPHDPYSFVNYLWLGQCHLLLGHADQAVDLLRKARSANPGLGPDLWLAAALGLRGDTDDAKVAVTEWLKSTPQLNSLARLRASLPPNVKAEYFTLREKTFEAGLRKAGLPEE